MTSNYGVTNTAAGKGCCPERPGQAWQVGLCKPHEVQQRQMQGGNAPGSGQSQASIGWVESRSRIALRRIQVLCDEMLSMSWQCAFSAQKAWAASQEAWPTGQGADSAPVGCYWSAPFRSGAPNIRISDCWSKSRRGPWRWSEGWRTSLVKTGWERWSCSAWRREVFRDSLENLPVSKGGQQKSTGGTVHKGM